MYVVELKTLCKNFTRLKRYFGVKNMLSCDYNWIYFTCNYTSLFLIPIAKGRIKVAVLILQQITFLLPKDRYIESRFSH